MDLLEVFHDEGFIHCDIKPDNIMIGDYTVDNNNVNKIYLIDFGISQKYLSDDGSHLPF